MTPEDKIKIQLQQTCDDEPQRFDVTAAEYRCLTEAMAHPVDYPVVVLNGQHGRSYLASRSIVFLAIAHEDLALMTSEPPTSEEPSTDEH